MGKHDKLLDKILRGRSDNNINFNNLTALLKSLGFSEHIRGSHHVYRKAGIKEMPNLQKSGNKAKGYQVKQVRNIILQYHLGDNE